MSIKAVIFDLGGVIVRTETQQPRQDLAQLLSLPPEQLYHLIFDYPTAIQATLGQVASQDHWEAVQEVLKISPEQMLEVQKSFFAGDVLDKDLVDYIRSLRPRYTTALLSNAWDSLRPLLAQEWKIEDAFDEIVISAEVGIAKPDPRIYHLILERLGVQAQEAVFVDDFAHNLEAAAQVGLHTVLFKTRPQAVAELQALLQESAQAR
jgi:glucose-1-phosphatase